ncbi:MAG: site-specific integrase [Peptococcaceae bacterium]|jgi:integrase|nr:site-specific integrase [Peptococcaceae bacterium]
MASISKSYGKDKHGVSIYQVCWREPDGTQKAKKVHGLKEAKAFKATVEREIETGQYVPDNNMTVEAYVDKWLESVKKTKKYKTFIDYRLIAKKHIVPALGKIKLTEVKPLHIRGYLEALLDGGRIDGEEGGLHPTTIKKHRRTLHLIFETALEDDLIATNPVSRVKISKIIPKSKERKFVPETLNRDEIHNLLELVRNTRLKMPVNVALFTATREGEVLALRWRNLDLEKRIAYVAENLQRQKTDKGTALVFDTPKYGSRYVALPKTLVSLLTQEKESQAARKVAWGPAYHDYDLVCCQDNGKPWEPSNISNNFSKLIKKSGLPKVRYHDLRHTICSTMSEDLGISANTIALQAGHTDPGFTSRVYIHSNMSAQIQAVDAFDDYVKPAAGRKPAGVSKKKNRTRGVSPAR